jgi:primosomal protein N' (replication factor Y)
MRILEVIPISKGINKETLSYFTGSDVSVGSIVKVPVRKKTVPALVVASREIVETKSEIKNASFSLKKIDRIKSFILFRKEFIEAAATSAEYFANSTGSILGAIVPKTFFEEVEKLKITEEKIDTFKYHAEKFVIQSSDEDRYAHYKSIIRENFAKNSSVFFCLPTIQDINFAKEKLHKGIESYTFVLHGLMNKKEILEKIYKIMQEKHPVLIIATGGYLALPKENIGTIILDKESSRAYKTISRPYIDFRVFAKIYAEKTKARLIFGDLMLRSETIYKCKKGEFVEIASLKFRSLSTSKETLIDMKKSDSKESGEEVKKKFKIFSPELEKKIFENFENNEHMFMFVSRRGLSPSTVCADCGNIVKCNFCNAHTVLHKGSENFFLCHKCGERRSANEKCTNCESWRLTTLGIGAEFVEEKIKELLPNEKIFRIDSDTTPHHKAALQMAQKFYNEPQGILIGTEMALLYLSEKVENSAVVSMDSFFSIPDFRINERVMSVLLKMRAITDRNLLIQTRDAKQKVFDYAMAGNIVDFYRDEIEDRKKFNYPPFSTIIKVSISGNKSDCVKSAEELKKMVAPYELDVFPAFVPQGKSKVILNTVLKIPEDKWPDSELSTKLRACPPNFSINVDPDSLI